MAYLVQVVLFLLPFVAFALWLRWYPQHAVRPRLLVLALIGIALGLAGAFWYGLSVSTRPGTVYIPATLGPDGQVVPGRAVPRP